MQLHLVKVFSYFNVPSGESSRQQRQMLVAFDKTEATFVLEHRSCAPALLLLARSSVVDARGLLFHTRHHWLDED